LQSYHVAPDVALCYIKLSKKLEYSSLKYQGFTKFYFTGEKAVKKKTLCTRMMASSLTSDAVTELILLSKGQRKPPMGYTLVGYGKYFLRRNCNRKCV